jgi:hypothetical protein
VIARAVATVLALVLALGAGPARGSTAARATGRSFSQAGFEAFRRALVSERMAGVPSAQPSGDHDGDGRGDVVTIEPDGDRSTLRARSGRDGSEIWSVPDVYAAQVVSLDHPEWYVPWGTTQVLALGSAVVGDGTGVEEYVQQLRLIAGDGRVIWTYTVPGSGVRPAGSTAVAEVEFVVSVVAPIGTASLSAQWDNVFGKIFVGTASAVQTGGSVRVTAGHFVGRQLTSGFDVGLGPPGGTVRDRGRIDVVAERGTPWVVPAVDDNVNGLAYEAYSFTPLPDGSGLLARRSFDGAVIWRQLVPAIEADPRLIPGTSSLVLRLRTPSGPRLFMFDGHTGAQSTLPDLGGFAWLYVPYTRTDLIRFAAGGDGATVVSWFWSGQYDIDPGARVVWGTSDGTPLPDLTGDRAGDLLMTEVLPDRVRVRAISGADGSVPWTATLAPTELPPRPLGSDLAGVRAEAGTVTVSVRRGKDFGLAWSASAPIDGAPADWFAEDLSGDEQPEIVLTVHGPSGVSFHAFGPSGLTWSAP